MGTYKAVLDARPRSSDGLHVVMVRIYRYTSVKKERYAHTGTGFYVKKKNWNPNKGEAGKGDRLFEVVNRALDAIKHELRTIEAREVSKGRKTIKAADIKNLYEGNGSDMLLAYYAKRIELVADTDSKSLNKQKWQAHASLRQYLPNDIPLAEFKEEDLRAYQTFMLNGAEGVKKRGQGTVNQYLALLKDVFEKATAKGLILYEMNPFHDFKKSKHKPKQPTMELDELVTLFQAPLEGPEAMWRDIYMAAFLSGGMRRGDILCLEKSNIVGNEVRYTMIKGDKDHTFPLTPLLKQIFDRYASPERDYIFPVMIKGGRPVEDQINYYGKIFWATLKEIAKNLKINPDLSPHSARRATADISEEELEMSLRDVQGALNHSSITTTERYRKRNKKADNVVIGLSDLMTKKLSKD